MGDKQQRAAYSISKRLKLSHGKNIVCLLELVWHAQMQPKKQMSPPQAYGMGHV